MYFTKMKTLQQQAKEFLASAQAGSPCYIRRYYGETEFRLNAHSGVRVPLEVLSEMAMDPEFSTKHKIDQEWTKDDDEFLLAAHVEEATQRLCSEMGIKGYKAFASPVSKNLGVRYWEVDFSYREFTGVVTVFDVNGLKHFLSTVKAGYGLTEQNSLISQ